MEALAQIIFKKIIYHLEELDEVPDVDKYLHAMVESFYQLFNKNITSWEITSRKIKHESSCDTHTLVFKHHRISVTYNFLFDLKDYATVLIELKKNLSNKNLSMGRTLFIYDFKAQRLVQIYSEAFKP